MCVHFCTCVCTPRAHGCGHTVWQEEGRDGDPVGFFTHSRLLAALFIFPVFEVPFSVWEGC